ncbi:T6SS effector BTH_I2691 family protein [uncultured Gilliamella sp.]|uniref:T6SS effector BTH_I2691 family protein n=1 Tax=uncultured Gilliamella sp. TaxID=1193505 RepID=UPI0025EA2CC2|nr:T6SS effector BTH_I2691 family protein [uncultured Gilliamella sp.]
MSSFEELLKVIIAKEAIKNNSGKRCPKCQEKEGDLVVLPTRLSITGYLGKNKTLEHGVEAKFELPPLPDFVKKMVSDLPIEHSNYCLQILRQGYLYVLEDRKNGQKQWRVFSSSQEGCLTEYDDINKIPNIPPKYNCNIATDGADASYISFKNSKDIFKIYFVFSPNKISNTRLELYQNTPEFELSGMTPDQIRNGQTSLKTQDILTNILEISTAMDIAEQEAFLNSKPVFEFKSGERDIPNRQLQVIEYIYTNRTTHYDKDILRTYMRYISLYNKLRKRQGVAIVVNDAIGITQSLNNRYHQAFEKKMKPWMECKDSEGISNEHRLIVYRHLLGFKESFHNHRIRQIIKTNKHWEEFAKWGKDKITHDYPRVISNNKSREIFQKAEEALIKQQTEELSQKEFQKQYWDRLSQDKFKRFEKEFNERNQSAEQLAEKRIDDYIKWLKSHQLVSALDLYDDTIPLDGIMFQLQMGVCLCGASGSSKVREVLDEWWLEPQVTPTNLCMRTYLFNNKALIVDINEYLDIQQNIAINESANNNEHSPDVDKAINLLNKLAEHVTQTGPIVNQLADRGFPIALLSVTFADLVRSFLRVTTQRFDQAIKNRFGNLIFARVENKAREMYQAAYNINGRSFTATANRGAPQITRHARDNFNNADLVHTKVAMMVLAFNSYETIKKLISGEIKNLREIAELSASVIGTVAAGQQVLTSAIECCIGDNPRSRTATVTYNAFGRLFLWSASLSLIAGGASSVFDLLDGNKAVSKGNYTLAIAYYIRSIATIFLSAVQFIVALGPLEVWLTYIVRSSIERTIWVRIVEACIAIGRFASRIAYLGLVNFYLSFVGVVISLCLIIFDDNAMQKWFDRCCFSKDLEREKFDDLNEELTEWHRAIQETF